MRVLSKVRGKALTAALLIVHSPDSTIGIDRTLKFNTMLAPITGARTKSSEKISREMMVAK